jgi:TatD DNase family protein
MIRFVDSHAHMFFKEYEPDLDEVIARASDQGVTGIVCPGTDLETSRASVRLAARFGSVRAAVGVHPHEASGATGEVLSGIEALSGEPGVVAIGEIGLDYHYDFSPGEVQQEVFRRQLAIAARKRLPVIIHSREAWEDTLRIVREAVTLHPEWRGRADADPGARGVFHCFPGDGAMAAEVISLGFYISFPGPLTFPEKPNRPNVMAQTAREVSLDHVLLETDSPYLTPHPHRGRRNEPAYLPFIASKLSELTGKTVAEIGEVTSRNTANLFGPVNGDEERKTPHAPHQHGKE